MLRCRSNWSDYRISHLGRKDSPFTLTLVARLRLPAALDGSAEKTLSSRLIGFAIAVGGMFAVLIGRL